MKKIIFISLLFIFSCKERETTKFKKISYSLKYDYFDSIAKKINPNKGYKYWQYAAFFESSHGYKQYTVLTQGGDTLLRNKINENANPIKLGLFERGHQSFHWNYAITIEKQKVNYVRTEEGFRDFLGTIDNLEEALLLARTYGYQLDNNDKVNQFRIIEEGFVLRLMKFHELPWSKEAVEITVNKNGYIKTKSLGIYCEGQDCYQ